MPAKKGTIAAGVFIVLLALLLITTHSAYAAPLIGVPVTITQPDGTVIHLFASGDEYYHWLYDANGYTVILDPGTGYYVYADLVKDSLVPTKSVAGKADPAAAGLRPHLNISPAKRTQIRQAFIDQTQKQGGRIHDAPHTGTLTNLVIFIRFAGEDEFTDATSIYTNMLTSSGTDVNSLYNYYREVSYNTLTVNSNLYPTPADTIISYEDSHARGYFQPYSVANPDGYSGGDGGSERRLREHALLRDAVNYINGLGQFPSGATIDADGDGFVDSVTFIVQGDAGDWASLLWPHAWSLYSYTVTINGKTVSGYSLQIQNMTNTGVLAHEMFHVLGAPDLYHYSYDGMQTVGGWDLMEFDNSTPEHMGCYMKYKYGHWISSIPLLSGSGTRAVSPLGTSSTNNCFKIISPASSTEYFVVEYRVATGKFESSLPGTGLLVYRINTAVGDGNADGPPDEVYLYRPGGTTSVNGDINTANFSTTVGRTAINDGTDPSSFLSSGAAGGLNISNIGAPGATISFDYSVPIGPPPATTLVSPSGTINNTTPTFTWNQESTASWYLLQVNVNTPNHAVIYQWYTSAQAACNGTTCSVLSTPLPAGAYTWWVLTNNTMGDGTWSSGMGFTQTLPIVKPPATTLVSPSGSISGLLPTYTWNQVNTSTWYLLQVNANTPNHAVIYQWYTSAQSNCNGTTCSVTPSTSLPAGSYTWWVLTYNSAGDGTWSSGMGFTQTLAIVKPPATTLVSPSGTISTTTPTYTWNAVSTATWYLLQVNVNTPNHSVIYQWYTAAEVGCSSGTGTCSITPATALLNGAYTWWVLTNNTAGDGTWSSGMTCTVSVVSTGFNSQFKGDATGWETHLGSWSIDSAEYYTGTPVYDSFSSASYAANFSNFQYEAKLWRNGCAGCSSGIMFRGTPDPLWSNGEWYTGYMFVYSRTGYYAIYREDPSAVFSLVNWTPSSYINQGAAYNTLRVAANGSSLYFYINGLLVWSGSDAAYPSGRAGVIYYSDGTAGDGLFVDYATLNVGSYSISDQVSAEQEALNAAAMQSGSHCGNVAQSCDSTPAGNSVQAPDALKPEITPVPE